MGNDLRNTAMLFKALEEPLALRAAIGAEYGIDVMSKSDAQVGEAIIKRRVEQQLGDRVERVPTLAGTTFRYPIPAYLSFERPDLRAIVDKLRTTDFMVLYNGKVELPEWLTTAPTKQPEIVDGIIHHEKVAASGQVTIGPTTYQMGIGGLHSTESNRSIHSDDEYQLVDFDVASYYPAIIINSGLYPKALGPQFLVEFRKIRDERVAAKNRVKEIDDAAKLRDLTAEEKAERLAMKAKEAGLKIALNGCFGKLGSPYSVLYAPHLMIAVTLTGQLALLMLIERAHRMGIEAVSGNTDGVVFRVPRSMLGPIEKDRVTAGALKDLIEGWEADTGFVMEATPYQSIYNQSVNSYIAVKPDGKAKWKGPVANPWRDDDLFKADLRGQLMKNPQMTILANAVVDLILHGTPIEDTIRSGTDIRDFVTVVNVKGGATWRGEYLGKVVRYYWAKDGEAILYKEPHPSTGNFKKVPKSDGCRPMMELATTLPDDIDYDAYITAAREILMDIGFDRRPDPIKPLRIYKYNAIAWFAVAAA